MNNAARYIGQGFAYVAFILFVGALSSAPTYQHLADDQATIKLSLRHAGQLLGECRQRTREEMADLPANMRAPEICPRERSALLLELDVNGDNVYAEELPPRGLHGDGRATVYRRLTVPAGQVDIQVRLKDDMREASFQYQQEHSQILAPAQILVIDFDEQASRFEFL